LKSHSHNSSPLIKRDQIPKSNNSPRNLRTISNQPDKSVNTRTKRFSNPIEFPYIIKSSDSLTKDQSPPLTKKEKAESQKFKRSLQKKHKSSSQVDVNSILPEHYRRKKSSSKKPDFQIPKKQVFVENS